MADQMVASVHSLCIDCLAALDSWRDLSRPAKFSRASRPARGAGAAAEWRIDFT